jgi:hypothetical protein
MVVTPATLKLSKSRSKLIATLAAEIIGKRPLDNTTGKWMERGTALEGKARDWFSFEKDVDVSTVGFITDDEGRIGCSPDGDICESAGLEIKNPSLQRHMEYLLDNDELRKEYKSQVQFSLWVTGWPLWYLLSFNPAPEVPKVLLEIEPDKAHQDAFDEHIPPFLKELDEAVARIRGETFGNDELGRAAAAVFG